MERHGTLISRLTGPKWIKPWPGTLYKFVLSLKDNCVLQILLNACSSNCNDLYDCAIRFWFVKIAFFIALLVAAFYIPKGNFGTGMLFKALVGNALVSFCK